MTGMIIVTFAIAVPNVFLSREYLEASSSALCASPTAFAATYITFKKRGILFNTLAYYSLYSK